MSGALLTYPKIYCKLNLQDVVLNKRLFIEIIANMEFIRRSLIHCKRRTHSIGTIGWRCNYSVKNEKDLEAEGPFPRRVITGLQPTGTLHVGNYFAALRRCVRLQDQGDDLMLFIADLHALTTYQEPAALQDKILDVAACALAAGVDPARSVVFAQSAVPRHAELCWLLACLATHARLAHLPQYKERAMNNKEVGVGLLLYPVLQAADVLLYRAGRVPVGADQLQHLQLAAQLVKTFHHRYRKLFPVPRALLPEDGCDRLRSLRDPSKKMSKSDPDPKSRILLTDPDDVIILKIRKAVTDCNPKVTFDPESRPGVSNLVLLHCLASDLLPEEAVEEADHLTTAQYKVIIWRSLALVSNLVLLHCLASDLLPEEAVEEADHLTTAQYKMVVAQSLCRLLAPIRSRTLELRAQPALLRAVLRDGAARARARADVTFRRVQRALGLLPAAQDEHDTMHDANK